MTDHADLNRRRPAPAELDPLTRAVAAREDDFEHPPHDALEAFVDGQVDDTDYEWVASHAVECAQCREDIGDLTAMRDALQHAAPAARVSVARRWLAAAAAVIIVGSAGYFWVSRGVTPVTTVATSAPAGLTPAPSAPPAPADPLTADERARIDRAVSTGTIQVSAVVAALASPRGTLLGPAGAGGDTFAPIAPVGTAVTVTTPAFTWAGVTGAATYDVAVFDDQFNEVASAKGLTGTIWTPSTPMPRGKTLSWQVTAHVAGKTVRSPVPPQPEARFMVIDAATDAAVTADRQRLKDDPLALAVLLAERGLYAEALIEAARIAEPAQRNQVRGAIQALQRR